MKKFNTKFNKSLIRFSFWDALTQELANFDKLLKPQDVLTREDRIALKKIHTLLYQSYLDAKECRELHSQKIDYLRKQV